MKKFNLKKIKILGLLVISCFMLGGFVGVNAKTLTYNAKNKASVKKVADGSCESKTNTCKDIVKTYGVEVTNSEVTEDDDRIMVTVRYYAVKKNGLSAAPGPNDFDIYVTNEDENQVLPPKKMDVTFTKKGSYYQASFEVGNNSSASMQFAHVWVVSANNELCCQMTYDDVADIAKKYISDYYTLDGIKDENGNIKNTYFGKSVYVRSISYVNEKEEVDYDQDFDEIQDNSSNESSSGKNFDATDVPEWNPAKTITAICETYKTITKKDADGSFITYSTAEDKSDYFVNKQSYKFTNVTTKNNCEKTCEEVITVEYGPPVASKAGMCFEYVVKATSKQKCSAKYKGSKPKSGDYITCTAYPKCNNIKGYEDQAGPTEEFDQCVLDCDGGKYSDKCVNKCYKKVYGDEITEKALNAADTVDALLVDLPSGCDQTLNNKSANVSEEELRKCAKASNAGYYTISGGSIIWVQGSYYWTKIGRYYLANKNKTARTILSLVGAGELRGGIRYRYVPDSGGFKRACLGTSSKNGTYSYGYYVTTCGKQCSQNCEWYIYNSGACSSANIKKNGYYSDSVSNECLGGEYNKKGKCVDGVEYINVHDAEKATKVNGKYVFINGEDAKYVYAYHMRKYKEEKEACMAAASCERTTQTEFTIQVTNKTSDGDRETIFPLNGNKDTITDKNVFDKAGEYTTILNEDNGTCITHKNEDEYDYRVIWSFPGTWINNKNGDISYKTPTVESGWRQKKDKFCLSLKSQTVNGAWYDWKLENDDGKVKPDTKASADAEDKDRKEHIYDNNTDFYNILAQATNFGINNWNIDIKCFYAIRTKTTDNGCSNPPCEDSAYNFEARTVDLTNLFPATTENNMRTDAMVKNSSGKTVEVGRQPGYNWTSDVESTDNTNPKVVEDYQVDPVSLIEKVQSGTTYTDDNIDYLFSLDRNALATIRDYEPEDTFCIPNSKERKTKCEDAYFAQTITSYRSSLIQKLGPTVRRKIGCNNYDKSSNDCEVIK